MAFEAARKGTETAAADLHKVSEHHDSFDTGAGAVLTIFPAGNSATVPIYFT